MEEGKLIRWRGRLGVRGIFDGDHELSLEEVADGTTRCTQRETFGGMLVPFVRRMLDNTGGKLQEDGRRPSLPRRRGSPSSVPR